MKFIVSFLLLLCTVLGLPAAFAGETTKADPYAQAVTAYVTAAGQQLHAIRGEVDTVTKNADNSVKQRYAGVYQELEQADKLLVILKTAEPKDFDRVKADFESTRNGMIKLLATVRRAN